jgi:hypothetical protein
MKATSGMHSGDRVLSQTRLIACRPIIAMTSIQHPINLPSGINWHRLSPHLEPHAARIARRECYATCHVIIPLLPRNLEPWASSFSGVRKAGKAQ